MVFDCYNSGEVLYESELRANQQAVGWGGYHLSGWDVTSVTTLTITFNAGNGVSGLGNFESTSVPSNVVISAGDSTYDRIDTIIYDESANQLDKIEGVPSSNPNPPDLVDYNDMILYRVHVQAGATSITTNDIYDVRAKRSEPIIREDRKIFNGHRYTFYSDDGSTVKIELDGTSGGIGAKSVSVTDKATGSGETVFRSISGSEHIPNFYLAPESVTNSYGGLYLEMEPTVAGTGFTRAAYVLDVRQNGGGPLTSGDILNIYNDYDGVGVGAVIFSLNYAGNLVLKNDLIIGGNIRVNGNDIKASDGNTNITMTSNTLTRLTGDLRVDGNDILNSSGNNIFSFAGAEFITMRNTGGNKTLVIDASTGNDSRILFNENTSTQALVYYDGGIDRFYIQTLNNRDIALAPDGTGEIIFDGNSFPLGTTKTYNMGGPSNAWDNMYADDFVNVASKTKSIYVDQKQALEELCNIKISSKESQTKGYYQPDYDSLPKGFCQKIRLVRNLQTKDNSSKSFKNVDLDYKLKADETEEIHHTRSIVRNLDYLNSAIKELYTLIMNIKNN